MSSVLKEQSSRLIACGYSLAELDFLSEQEILHLDAVGNPHHKAKADIGEVVVDVGSGYGGDAFLASDAVGPTGEVVGVNLCRPEVQAAQARAVERKVDRSVKFKVGDFEALPVEDDYADVLLVNGGFDMVQDREKALSEIRRVLRPGGRLAMTCTVARDSSQPPPGTFDEWPPSVQALMVRREVGPLLQDAGFKEIAIDTLPSEEAFPLGALAPDIDLPALESRVRYLLPDKVDGPEVQFSDAVVEAQKRLADARQRARIRSPQGDDILDGLVREHCERITVLALKPDFLGRTEAAGQTISGREVGKAPFQAGFMLVGFLLSGLLTFGPIFLRKRPKYVKGEYGKSTFGRAMRRTKAA